MFDASLATTALWSIGQKEGVGAQNFKPYHQTS